MTNRKVIRNPKEARQVAKQMAAAGYVPLPRPAQMGITANDPLAEGTMTRFVHDQIYAGSKDPTDDENPNPGVPRVFATGGAEQAVSNCGTKNLGYIQWGADNTLPNRVAILTEMLPYMSASHKFNVDLVTGIGVEPTFCYTQYIGGNITEKEIAYSSAGELLKGWKLDVLRELSKLDSEQQSSSTVPGASAQGEAAAVPAGSPAGSNPYRKALEARLAEIETNLETWERVSAEVAEFFKRNNTLQTFLHTAADQVLLGMSFPEIDVQQSYIDPDTKHEVKTFAWKPKAVDIRWRSAMTCRVEKMDDEGKINYIYVSNQWLNPNEQQSATDLGIDAIRALDPLSPTENLKSILRKTRQANVHRNNRPTRFILPTRIASPGRPYYPVPPHYSVFAGRIYDYAFTMIEDRATAKKNANVIGYVIYVHNDYLRQLYDQEKADTPELRAKARDGLFAEINTFLTNRDNHGKPLVAIEFRDADGKTAKAWEIIPIENNRKNTVEANERELQEISSIIFFSWGVDARLIGNSPGDVSSSGGTDLRERYLLKQIQMSSTQQLLLRPYYVVRDINDWDPQHLRFRIKREVLTTLDNSKTGITTAQDN